ncbi:MAG: L,D-transpeptidase family protein [Rhizobiales bacterium]|nr:L,D-transpeptidase family protein [Hyphomicrobiales bacterium]
MRTLAIAVLAVIALFASTAADANVIISIDKSTQRMTVSVDGATRWTWPVSTGRRGHATPAGSFKAFRMEEDHYSKEWDDAPMPHSIFFTKRGHAIHGSFETRRLGTPASAGCVRLHPNNAKQLFALVKKRGVLNTSVVISGEEPRRSAPAVATQKSLPKAVPSPRRTVRGAPQYDDEIEYADPRARRRSYRQPAHQQHSYPRGYYPPAPPGYYYAPQPAPQDYHYYR